MVLKAPAENHSCHGSTFDRDVWFSKPSLQTIQATEVRLTALPLCFLCASSVLSPCFLCAFSMGPHWFFNVPVFSMLSPCPRDFTVLPLLEAVQATEARLTARCVVSTAFAENHSGHGSPFDRKMWFSTASLKTIQAMEASLTARFGFQSLR